MSKKDTTADRIDAIAEAAGKNCEALIREAAEEIKEAMRAALTQSEDSDGPAVLRVGFAIGVSLTSNNVDFKLSFGVRRTLEASQEVDDPRQEKLL